MRGGLCDSYIGIVNRPSGNIPDDSMAGANVVIHPQTTMAMGQNFGYNIRTRRNVPIQMNMFPGSPTTIMDNEYPIHLVSNGVALIPDAGIYQRSDAIKVKISGGNT